MWSAPMPDLSPQTSFGAAGLPVQLEEARRELRDEILRGHGGRAALARFSDRLDAIVRQIAAAAPRTPQPVAVVAIRGHRRPSPSPPPGNHLPPPFRAPPPGGRE